MNEKQNDALADYWLHAATSDLCDEAKERIASEVKPHYADLVAAHVAEGTDLIDARLKSLDDLGDAKVAAKRFRREHFTRQDERALSNLLQSLKMTPFVIGLLLHIWVTVLAFLIGGRLKTAICVVSFTIFIGLPWTTSIFARRVAGRNGITRALLSDIIAKIVQALFVLISLTLHDWPPRPRFIITLVSIGLSWFMMAWPSYRMWRKFNREQKRRNEMVEAN